MKGSEKRSSPRRWLQIPVLFRSFEIAPGDREIATKTINVSHSGLFLTSPQRLKLGSSLFLTLRVPTEISGSVFAQLKCRGRVGHEQQLGDETLAYGVEIEQMAPHSSRELHNQSG